jgi:hypothetical protein
LAAEAADGIEDTQPVPGVYICVDEELLHITAASAVLPFFFLFSFVWHHDVE